MSGVIDNDRQKFRSTDMEPQQMITQSLFFPREQGDFQEKQGGD